MEFEEGLNVAFFLSNISNGDGSVDEIGVVLYCKRPKFHGFPSFKDFSISFLVMPTKASAKPLLCGWCGLLVMWST